MSYRSIMSRTLSLIVAIALVAAATWHDGGAANLIGYVTILLMPLVLIWFPDVLGDYIGPVRGGYVDTRSPGFLVAAAGWFFLLGIPLIAWWLR